MLHTKHICFVLMEHGLQSYFILSCIIHEVQCHMQCYLERGSTGKHRP